MANRRYPIVLITFTLTPRNNWPTGKYLAEQMMGEEGKCIIIARSAAGYGHMGRGFTLRPVAVS